MPLDSNGVLGKLFEKLVKNKMSAIAIPVAGLIVSFTVLTFSKAFVGPIGDVIAWAGLSMMLIMLAMFTIASTVLVWRNLREPPKTPPVRGPGGQFVRKPNEQPMAAPVQDPPVLPAVSATS